MESPATASLLSEKSLVIQKREALPATLNRLKSFVIFQEETAKNYKSRLLLLKEAHAVKAQVDATFEDALKVSEMLFQAYERLGELVEKHTAKPTEAGKMRGKARKPRSAATDVLNIRALAREMKVSESWLAQMKLLSKNPKFAKEAFKTARELGPDVGVPPTKTQIISSIRSAERQFGPKRAKVSPSELRKCTKAVLDALKHLKEADWRDLEDSDAAAFNDAVLNFQEKLHEFHRLAKQKTGHAPETIPSTGSGQNRLHQPGLLLRWIRMNWPLFPRLFTTTFSRIA